MTSREKILVVTESRNLRRYVTRSLASAGYQPSHCGVAREAIAQQLAHGLDMCIVDADGDADAVRWLLQRCHDDFNDLIVLVVSFGGYNSLVRELLFSQNLNNLIAKHGGISTQSEIIDETELMVTCQKLFRKELFGIEKYLSSWAIKVNEMQVRSAADKNAALKQVQAFLEDIDCFGAIRPAVVLTAEELIMNAIYNAPRDAAGQPKYKDKDRQEPLELEPSEEITFRYACDGKNLALSVTDQFGSLDRDVIVKYLERCFSDQKGVMEEKKAGAGLGLYMVFNSITQLTFNIKAGEATEVIALFYVRGGARALRASGRSLNIFMLQ